jgi:hypothetical protein
MNEPNFVGHEIPLANLKFTEYDRREPPRFYSVRTPNYDYYVGYYALSGVCFSAAIISLVPMAGDVAVVVKVILTIKSVKLM